jgi:hypothetical protein
MLLVLLLLVPVCVSVCMRAPANLFHIDEDMDMQASG